MTAIARILHFFQGQICGQDHRFTAAVATVDDGIDLFERVLRAPFSAQIIDDKTGTTLAHASSLEKDIASELKYGGNVAAATRVGQILAERALANGVTCATVDRRSYRYHGRVAALADAARAAGLDLGGKVDSAE